MLNTPEQIHAQKLWEYLDTLAESNPEEYKNFISSQMSKGKELFQTTKPTKADKNDEIPEESMNFSKDDLLLHRIFNQQSEGSKIIKVNPSTCLRFKIKKLISNSKSNTKEIKILSNENNVSSKDISEIPKISFSTTFLQDTINSTSLIHEPKIYLNIIYSNDFYLPLDSNNQPEKTMNINNWSYIPSSFRPSGSKKSMRGITCLIYDCIIHSNVNEMMKKNDGNKSNILSYICRKFNIFLNCYCELYLKNVKILESHKYKGISFLPQEWNIGKCYENEKKLENFSKTNEKLSLTSNNNQVNKSLSENKPKIELKSKEIVSNNEMELVFALKYFEENELTMNNIDLLISEDEIKIQIENMDLSKYTPVYLDFKNKFKIDENDCDAKYNKEKKELKIRIKKL